MQIDFRALKPFRDYQRSLMLVRRLLVLRVLIIGGFVLLGGIFWYLQIAHGPEYRRKAEENRLRRRIERPVRGLLLDASGEILATNRPSFAVYLDRQRTDAPREAIRELAELLDDAPEPLIERFEQERDQPRFMPIRLLEDVGLETAARIEAHRPELPAIDVGVEARRHYPLGGAAAHAIGYTSEVTRGELERDGLLPGDRVGRTGAEASYDGDLRGEPGLMLEEVNARGRPLRAVATVRPTRHGRPLKTTFDAALQKDLADAFAGRGGAAVFIDPASGALRAIYSGPSFDPNLFAGRLSSREWRVLSEDPRRALQNRALASGYSPGSTFKLLMAAAAAEEEVIGPGETVYCGGSAVFYGRRFHCHRRWGHGHVGLVEAITRSCNVFFYTVGDRLGIERIAKWARRFGLGRPTKLGLAGEIAGL
ncbi:MAG: penicillin-binding protein 2, partial [Acidobacteriota bacterium]